MGGPLLLNSVDQKMKCSSERPGLSFKKHMLRVENGVDFKRLRCVLVEGYLSSIMLKAPGLTFSSTRRKECGLEE